MLYILKRLKKTYDRNFHIRSFLRPFFTLRSKHISPNNRFVGAYFLNGDYRISNSNRLINAHFKREEIEEKSKKEG